ncbi:hypothetical protein L873DRAFT_1792747 [Choiromyces venosus 120613-1]|uniref:Uncharacterized protein n=1 Tax=Choiromyces venosus 120613-1 TaxID=1336337 RepID=A0A3N4J8Y3_9PEZI|nr:hypothetical protein L873DRAFT_1792747 [Choiromyces venosus 120613-1]
MSSSPLHLPPPHNSPEPLTPALQTTPKTPMAPYRARVLRSASAHAVQARGSCVFCYSPIGRSPDSSKTVSSNSSFCSRVRSPITAASTPTNTLTTATSPSTSPHLYTLPPPARTLLPINASNLESPTPPRRCTPSYLKAQSHIANLRSILTRVRDLNQSLDDKFTPEVQKNLCGIQSGLTFLLENDLEKYLFLKKEGRGKGIWKHADLEGLERRSGFWVGVWRGVRGGIEGVEDVWNVGKRKREEEGEAESVGKKGKYEDEET